MSSETKEVKNKLEIITQALLANPNSETITIKATGGTTSVSKIVLIALSDVLQKIFEDFKGAELVFPYPLKQVRAIINSMHSSSKFDCSQFDVGELFNILKFAVSYNINYLIDDIKQYLKTLVLDRPDIINGILINYDYGDVGRDIYQEAVRVTIIHRHQILRDSVPCCGEVYKYNSCCYTPTGTCRGTKEKCCQHRSQEDLTKVKNALRRKMDEYATILKGISLRAYEDITKRELERML